MTIEGLIFIAVGIVAVVSRKTIVQQRFDFNRFMFGMKFSPAEAKYGEVIGIVIGILFIIFGLLTMLGIIESN